jgi:hypothetical protein
LKGMIRSRNENQKPFAPNSLKIPTRQHRCYKVAWSGVRALAFLRRDGASSS